MKWTAALAASLVSVIGLPVLAASACPTPEQGFRRLTSPEAEVAYRWDPADVKVGQFFTAEIVACRTQQQDTTPEIKIDATMPAHGHGMNYRPTATSTRPGHYRFTGLMLHMPGTWRVTIDLLQGGKRTRLTHELNLKP